MSIRDYTNDELQSEIYRREYVEPPQMKSVKDDAALKKILKKYVEYRASEEYHGDNDYTYYIYETAIATYYDKDEFWAWYNRGL